MASSRMLVLQDQEWLSVWGKSAHSHIVRLMNSRQKRSKKNDDKSAVAMLKKRGNWQRKRTCHRWMSRSTGETWEREVTRNWVKIRLNVNLLMHGQLCCVFQDMTPPKSVLRKGTDMPKPIQRVKFTKAIARHTKIRDQNPSLGYICPSDPHQRNPNAPKIWGSVSGRDGKAKSKVPAK